MVRFLRHAVERTLEGDRAGLKESVIGAAVFDRPSATIPKSSPKSATKRAACSRSSACSRSAARRRARFPAALVVGAAIALAILPSTQREALPQLTTVTSYPGFQSSPSLSPDGNEVTFIWTGEVGGPPKIYIAR